MRKKFNKIGRDLLGILLILCTFISSALQYPVYASEVQTQETPLFAVCIGNCENGTVRFEDGTAGEKQYQSGDTVALQVTPDEGYTLEDFSVTSDAGAIVPEKDASGNMTFVMPESAVAVTATFIQVPVPASESQGDPGVSEPEAGPEPGSETGEGTEESSESGAKAPEPGQEAERESYTVSFGCLNHCNVLINGSAQETTVKAGEEVILTVEAQEGFMIDLVAVIDDSDTQLVLEKVDENVYRFIMPERAVIVSAVGKYALMLMAAYGVGDSYSVTVSEVRYPESNPNGTQIVGEYIEFSNGAVGFCTQHLQTAPSVGARFTVNSVCTNDTIRKALYYGWHGPADLGIGYQSTHLAVSVANGYPDSAWKVGQAFLNRIASLAVPPAEFKVYILSSGVSGVQEVAIWEYNPIQYIRIAKTFETGGNAYNPNASAAVYAIFKDAACTQRYGTPYISGNPSAFRIEADNMSGVIPVEPGVYYVKEIQAPSGYALDTTVYKMDCTNKSYTNSSSPLMITSNDKIARAYIRIKKTFESGGSAYNPNTSAAVYGIYKDSACTQSYVTPFLSGSQWAFRIESDGMTGQIPVEPGIYYVKEVSAPSGYVLDTTVYKADCRSTTYQSISNPLMIASNDKINRAHAKVVKTSSNTDITNGNNCYSLSGAVYGVYASKSDAQNNKNAVATLSTNANGQSNTVDLIPGTYYFKEITAPKGYELDPTIVTKTLTAGQTVSVSFSDKPLNDPDTIELKKIQQDGDDITPAPLSGAQFTVKYYDGYYTSETLPSLPKRTWVIETKTKIIDGKEVYFTTLADEYKISGDDFYYQSGKATLPLGTISIQETKAPTGYLLEGGYLQAAGSSTKVTGVYVAQIKSSTSGVFLEGGNVFSMYDGSIKGGVSMQKVDATTGNASAQGSASLAGAVYAIENDNDFEVIVNGTAYAKGAVVLTMTTDANGVAKTANNILPYGRYKVYETQASTGYTVNAAVQTVNITTNNTVVALASSMPEQVILGGVKVQKFDAETGLPQAAPGTTFEGAEVAIISLNPNPVQINGTTYANGETVMTLSLDASGTASTSASVLPYGHYKLLETKAPAGYVLDGTLEREFDITKNGVVVDMTSEGNAIIDKQDKGSITITKKGDYNNALAGVSFLLERYDADTDTWMQITESQTDSTGKIIFTDLIFGDYRITETKTLPGMTLLPEPVLVTLPYSVAIDADQRGDPDYTIGDMNYYKDITFNVTNSITLRIPHTGGRMSPLIIVGVMCMVISTFLFLRKRNNFKVEENL